MKDPSSEISGDSRPCEVASVRPDQASETLVEPSTTPYKEEIRGPVGTNARRIDGVEKVTGAALYGADLFHDRADLFAQVVRADIAHGNLRSVKAEKALEVPGVIAVYTSKDAPGTNRQGLIHRDHPVLVEDRILYRGDAIAIVVAESERAAQLGRDSVMVECDALPVIATMDDALAPDAPKLHPEGNLMGGKRIRKGDADAALDAADVVVSETFETQTVDHAFLDIEAGVARWDGRHLTIQVSGQWAHEERRLVALALGLPLETVRIICPATGGAFGGREDISIQIYLGMVALRHPNKTVAMRYSREESMRARHKRHALRIHYTLGATSEGILTAAKITVFSEEGAYASTGPAVLRKAASHATGPYRVPNIHVDVYGIFTNNNPTGAMRGFGACQMAIAYEGMMDRLAARLKLDRREVRLRNLIRNGDSVTTGQVVPICTAVECVESAWSRFDRGRRKDPPLLPHQRRGVGMSVICFGLGYGDGFPDASRATVRFSTGGRLEVYTGGVEYGQGLITIMAQIAAEELGLATNDVDVVWADTDRTHESGSSSATRQTYFTGNAVKIAASELREQVLDVAGRVLQVHPHELDLVSGAVVGRFDRQINMPLREVVSAARERGYSLTGEGIFKPRTVCENFETGQSPRSFITYLFASHIAQVVVDVETGEVRVERYIACHDVGRAINPQSVAGQMVGGATQGIGMALMEEVVMKEGRMLNPNFTDYILPTFRDVPEIETVILEHDDPGGPFGARGVGEPPLIAAVPAVLGAIGDAIGVMPDRLPCTPQRVWEMINGFESSRGEDMSGLDRLTPEHARMAR
ncbi:MAG: xanthine dehydrogenase family protein molybdopterin-binding subunit [Phycisphaerae bacterium]|nr:xanthine dehydrogenase family protein molybdopterin-binding subunit [Phycisphaerae bacterium]